MCLYFIPACNWRNSGHITVDNQFKVNIILFAINFIVKKGTVVGISHRIFIYSNEDTLVPVPNSRWERLYDREPGESMPEYAGQRIKYIEAILEFSDRKPSRVISIRGYIAPFDSRGRIDTEQVQSAGQLGFKGVDWSFLDKTEDNVISAESHFYKRQYQAQWCWDPPADVREQVINRIFNRKSNIRPLPTI
jgi:hypothetical protein